MKPKRFGDRLAQERRHKSVREERDVPKNEVAREMGVSESTLGRWESGESMPDPDVVQHLADYFGVTPGWLLFGQEPREAPRATEVAPDPRAKPLLAPRVKPLRRTNGK